MINTLKPNGSKRIFFKPNRNIVFFSGVFDDDGTDHEENDDFNNYLKTTNQPNSGCDLDQDSNNELLSVYFIKEIFMPKCSSHSNMVKNK
ncbi:hypothetical protein BpHYR1_026571 [Brachionus plicatilis]|uniref:Uncharacterized protein n=1 Tax=Brachionus plicatilis TaxID=10195 RepID=A0A3M7PE24_BRAPC|nr:hypothetical protein BpHYR1_026571 [Brachionus plicatilis]